MADFKITYDQALKIVKAKDKEYVDDILTLFAILKKRPSCASVDIGHGQGIPLTDYVHRKYEDVIVEKAKGFIVADCLKRAEEGTF